MPRMRRASLRPLTLLAGDALFAAVDTICTKFRRMPQ
jgi:hypothetical protein